MKVLGEYTLKIRVLMLYLMSQTSPQYYLYTLLMPLGFHRSHQSFSTLYFTLLLRGLPGHIYVEPGAFCHPCWNHPEYTVNSKYSTQHVFTQSLQENKKKTIRTNVSGSQLFNSFCDRTTAWELIQVLLLLLAQSAESEWWGWGYSQSLLQFTIGMCPNAAFTPGQRLYLHCKVNQLSDAPPAERERQRQERTGSTATSLSHRWIILQKHVNTVARSHFKVITEKTWHWARFAPLSGSCNSFL